MARTFHFGPFFFTLPTIKLLTSFNFDRLFAVSLFFWFPESPDEESNHQYTTANSIE